MQFRNVLATWLILSAILCLNCSRDPAIIITSPAQIASIYGSVSPYNTATHISILLNADTIATTTVDTENGRYSLRNIPYGYYTLLASNGVLSSETHQVIDRPICDISTIDLYNNGKVISASLHDDGDTLRPSIDMGDSLILFTFLKSLSTYFNNNLYPLKITPAILQNQIIWRDTTGRDGNFDIPVVKLFSFPEITITWYARITDSAGTYRMDSASFRYILDSTGLGCAKTMMLLTDVYPRNNSSDVSRETSVSIEFSRAMNHDSVEQSITISPPIPKTFNWNNNLLIITPANALNPLTLYTITLDTSAMTLDSMHFGIPYVLVFKTGDQDFFISTWPTSGAINIPINVPFQFSSPYSIEPELLQSAFSITPPVDSLVFTKSTAGLIKVSHALLLADTTYKITIDETCQSRKGVMLGSDLNIVFRTVTAP